MADDSSEPFTPAFLALLPDRLKRDWPHAPPRPAPPWALNALEYAELPAETQALVEAHGHRLHFIRWLTWQRLGHWLARREVSRTPEADQSSDPIGDC